MDSRSEDFFLSLFINGLKPHIGRQVSMNRPSTYEQSKEVAISVDASYQSFPNYDNYGKPKYGQNRYSNDNHKMHKYHDSHQKNHNNSNNNQNNHHNSKAKREKSCFKCKKNWVPGHICETYNNQASNERRNDKRIDYKQSSSLFGGLTARCRPNLLLTTATINGVDIENCVLDTGASQSVISKQIISKINRSAPNKIKETEQPTKVKIANGEVVNCFLTNNTQVIVGQKATHIEFVIMEQDSHTLLGLDWFRQTKCVLDCVTGKLTFPKEEIIAYQNDNENEEKTETFIAEIDEEELMEFASWEDEPKTPIQIENKNITEDEKKEIVQIIESYDIFANDYNKLGSCTVGVHTLTTVNEKPIYVPPYRKSYKEREEIKEEVYKMLEAGIIQHSSPWSFPVVQVPKKNGTRRFCVDFRKLNSITQQDCFPLPRIDDILDRLSASKVFTTIDLKSGYWQVKLGKDSIPKTAFSTPD
jgi:predicted aspartyl protease